MRVFITGATGFVGGALVRALAQDGAEVHALARSVSARGVLDGIPIIWHEGDITIPQTLSGVFEGADWIIHAAGLLGKFGVSEQVYQRSNVEGTRNVLEAALASASRARVLHVSSPGVLGPTTREPVAEDAPYFPSNPYERSKTTAEQVARDFAKGGLDVLIARPGFIYGPGDRHVLGVFKAIRSGHFFYIDGGRHFCHPTFIADAVAGMLMCLRRGRRGEAYHIVGPSPVTFRTMGETIATALGVGAPWLSLPRWLATSIAIGAEMLGSVLGRTPPLTRTGVAFFSEDRVFSRQKAGDELGYAPQHDLAMGASGTVAWYREHGWL